MTSSRSRSPNFVIGLNTIRLLAAVWVVCGHGAIPDLRPLAPGMTGRILNAFFHLPFNGTAAVMVFFIVSGLCIHLPYVKKPVLLAEFYTRRYVRIGLPLLCAVTIMKLGGGVVNERGEAVLWSLYAELAYYTIYPGLMVLARRIGIVRLVQFAFVASISMTVTHLHQPSIRGFGLLTWLWGLPIWLLGCLLAEQIAAGHLVRKPRAIWLWRITAVLCATLAMIFQFHSPVPVYYPSTMLVFGLFAFFWMRSEIQQFVLRAPWTLFEEMGKAGYSLYLVHNLVLGAFQDLVPWAPTYLFALQWAGVGCATFVFYKVVEQPAHRSAKTLAAAVAGLQRSGTTMSGA